MKTSCPLLTPFLYITRSVISSPQQLKASQPFNNSTLQVDFSKPRGIGEKMVLREVAKMLGLESSSALPKKAIQFGSKIAKLEGKKEKGNQACVRLSRKVQGT